MSEAKKTPAEVWKILPLKHKIISVVVAIVVASFSAFGIYYAITKEFPKLGFGGLTPARDLTGTWRNPISGQGLILDMTVSDDLLPEEEADISVHFDVEWNITQSGNSVAGPVTLNFVKASGRFAATYPDMAAKYKQMSGTYFWTGTVEGLGLTIDFYWGFSDPPKPLKCRFTADIMTCTVYTSPEEEAAWYAKQRRPSDIPQPTPVNLGHRAKLSLSRVW